MSRSQAKIRYDERRPHWIAIEALLWDYRRMRLISHDTARSNAAKVEGWMSEAGLTEEEAWYISERYFDQKTAQAVAYKMYRSKAKLVKVRASALRKICQLQNGVPQ